MLYSMHQPTHAIMEQDSDSDSKVGKYRSEMLAESIESEASLTLSLIRSRSSELNSIVVQFYDKVAPPGTS
ncbi:hypothetical protein ACSBR1_037630 [Camellia fascicularis]